MSIVVCAVAAVVVVAVVVVVCGGVCGGGGGGWVGDASVHPCQASASGCLMDHVVVAVLIAVATANLKLDVGHLSPCC